MQLIDSGDQNTDFNKKRDAFDAYFQIKDTIYFSLEVLPDNQPIPDTSSFEDEIPAAFRLANEVNTLDVNALKSLRKLGDAAEDIAEYFRAQTKKIDLILSHILANEKSELTQHQTYSYGGGGLKAELPDNLNLGQKLRLKIQIPQENAAIYCYGEVINQTQAEQTDSKLYSVVFMQIRDEDQEIMVRSSLHAQSKQLKKIAEDKKNH